MPRFYFHLFVVCCLATIPKLKANKQPNVLILIADQLRYQSIGFDNENGLAVVDAMPALRRIDFSNVRAQLVKRF